MIVSDLSKAGVDAFEPVAARSTPPATGSARATLPRLA